jgi:hypothetical protein
MAILVRTSARNILVAGLCSFVLTSWAFSQKKLVTLEDLTRNSEVVAVGQVKNMTSEWDESRTRIRTKVLLSVDQYVVGSNSGSTLTLYVPGGEVDGVGEIYSHMPVFKKEEQVMVFAAQDKLHHFRVAEGEQGKFTLQRDENGKVIVPGHATLEEFTKEVKNTAKQLKIGN